METKKLDLFRKYALLILLFLPVWGYTQTSEKSDKKINLSLGYGLVSYFYTPNYETTEYILIDSVNNIQSSHTRRVVTDIKIKPIYLRFDYKWDRKNSIGCMVTYNAYRASGIRTDSTWNTTTSIYDISDSKLLYSMHRLRFQMVYTRHFFVDRPKVNTYFYAALGVNLVIDRVKEKNVFGFGDESFYSVSSGFPIASRLCYGLRYNFSESMSLFTEAGLGGPLLSIGLTAKF